MISRRALLTAGGSAAAAWLAPATARAIGKRPAPDGERLLYWSLEEQSHGFRRFDSVFPVRTIARGATAHALPKGRPMPVRFTFGGEDYDLAAYARDARAAGLLVLKDGSVAEERYADRLTRRDRWTSFSMEKSFVSVLIGIAIEERHIASVEDRIGRYVPALRGSELETLKLRDVLQMSSGMEWNENYLQPEADANAAIAIWTHGRPGDLLRYIGGKRIAWQPGSRFEYNSANTQLLVEVVKGATGIRPSAYLSERVWKPLGMESNGWWQIEQGGGIEDGSICATLRDFGRFGQMMCDSGRAGGRQIVPASWIAESTAPSPANPEYGYHWWLDGKGGFAAEGIYGQMIHVDPAARLVVVTLRTRMPIMGTPNDQAMGKAFLTAVKSAYAS